MVAWLLGGALLLVAIAFAVFTWGILPRLDHYRPDLERLLSENTGYQVQIQSLSGRWSGLAPELTASGLRLSAGKQGPAMTLQRVLLKPSWSSLFAWEPRFSLVRIDAPSLALWRDAQRRIYLNGLPLTSDKKTDDNHLDDWLLRQDEVLLDRVRISWHDEAAGVGPLVLQNGSLRLTNPLFGHRLQVSADAVEGFGQSLTFDANWRGNDVHRWREWSGNVDLGLKSFTTGNWTRYLAEWVDWQQGSGGGTLRLKFNKGRINTLQGDWRLRDLAFIPQGARAIALPRFDGEINVERRGKDEWRLDGRQLNVAGSNGTIMQQAALTIRYRPGKQGGGDISLDRIDLTPLQPLLAALDKPGQPKLAPWQPRGVLTELTAGWHGELNALQRYNGAMRFTQLGWQANDGLPGMSGLSGQVNISEKDGKLTLNSQKSAVALPQLFQTPLPLDSLVGQIGWKRRDNTAVVNINSLRLANSDLSAQLNGQYRYPGQGSGYLDLAGRLDRVKAAAVPRYLPRIMNRNTTYWLNHAFHGGQISTASLLLRGDLDQFPFYGGKGGQFHIDARLDKVNLLYGPEWPRIDNISGRMQFINEGMLINADSGVTMGVPLSAVMVKIPDLNANEPVLLAEGKANGQLPRLLAFTAKIPTSPMLADFAAQLRGTGNVQLAIKLNVPLNHSRDATVNGDVQLAGNSLVFTKLPAPEAKQIAGTLHFNEHGVTARGIKLAALGGQFTLNAMLDPKQRFEIEGEADSHAVVKQYVSVLEPFVSGRSRYKVQFTIGKDLDDLKLESTLAGTRLSAPAPLTKAAADTWPLQVMLRPGSSGWALNYTLGRRSQGVINMKKDGALTSGLIGVGNVAQNVPPGALAIRANTPSVDLTPWITAFTGGSGGKSSGPLRTPLQIELTSQTVSVYGRELNNVRASLANNIAARSWSGKLESRQISGEFDYFTDGNGLLKARLPRLDLGLARTNLTKTGKSRTGSSAPTLSGGDLPALDISVDQLRYKGGELGRLTFSAHAGSAGSWRVPTLQLVNPDGSLRGSLTAYGGDARRVDSEFAIESGNIGSLLNRLGYKDAIDGGQGSISGKLGWPGRLQDFDESRLSGDIRLSSQDGRFVKLDQGAARLLGVLSLQSLTRRAKLDFSDIFGGGFAYDRISGTASVKQGIFSSNDLFMTGPSADVAIRGQVDLNNNSQDLQIKVEPHLSGGVALTAGAVTLNPLVGLAALAAQKIMRDPFDKMMSIQYDVTGTFNDPVVKKRGTQQSLNNGEPADSSAPMREKTR